MEDYEVVFQEIDDSYHFQEMMNYIEKYDGDVEFFIEQNSSRDGCIVMDKYGEVWYRFETIRMTVLSCMFDRIKRYRFKNMKIKCKLLFV